MVTLSGAPASVAVVYGGSHFVIDGTSLSVSGVPSVPGPDVTSFEDTSVYNGGSIAITGPATVQGGVTLGRTSDMSSGSITYSGAGIKLSGAVGEAAPGLGSATITAPATVSVEPFTVLNIATKVQNRGLLHTRAAGPRSCLTAGSAASDGRFTTGT